MVSTVLAMLVGIVFALLYPDPETGAAFDISLAVLFPAVIVPWGLFARTQRNLLRSSHERARQLEAEQHARVEQAREAERRRIAGEMHDVLAHRLSLLSRARGRARVPPGRAAGGDRRGGGRDPRDRARGAAATCAR